MRARQCETVRCGQRCAALSKKCRSDGAIRAIAMHSAIPIVDGETSVATSLSAHESSVRMTHDEARSS
jgi:hypothetical protein